MKLLIPLLFALMLIPGSMLPGYEPSMGTTNYAAPVFFIVTYPEIPDGNSLALWYFDNDLTDETGTYNMAAEGTGNAAAYGQTAPPQGTHHLSPNADDANTCVHTNGNITGTVKTFECFVHFQTGITTNKWLWDGDGGVNVFRVQYHLLHLYFCIDGNYNIHDELHAADTWYHYGITMSGAADPGIEIFKDNISIKEYANDYISVDKTWHIGNQAGHATASDYYVDEVHLSDVIRTVFKDGTP